jgi:PAS domain S-box-containing protein
MTNKSRRTQNGDADRAERKSLGTREQWMLAAVEGAVEGIATIDERGIILFVNPAMEGLFGYQTDEMVGRNVSMLMPSPYRESHDGYIERYLSTGDRRIIGIGRDVVGERKDGTVFPMHLAVSEVRMGARRLFTGFLYDISERKKHEELQSELLKELNKRNREINCLYRIGEAVRASEMTDETFHRVIEILRGALSHPAVTGVRISIDQFVYESDDFQETPWAVVSRITAAQRDRGDVRACLVEESLLHDDELENEKSLLDGVAAVLSDAIERSEAEAKVIHASKLASIGELAAGVGHEINNPVNGIINCADIILKEATPDSNIAKFAGLIRSEADRIATIVHSLLTFSRQEKQQHSLAKLTDVIDTVMSLCSKKLEKSHISVDVDVPENLPRLYCRSEQLQQVFMNLVINAMHALDERYPGADPNKVLAIRAQSHMLDDRPGIRVTVEDHGTGIPEVHRQRMFDPFFTTKGRDKGTGLGLSISDGIVRAHGGSIECETEAGTFTRFHVDLPLRPDSATVTERGVKELQPGASRGD